LIWFHEGKPWHIILRFQWMAKHRFGAIVMQNHGWKLGRAAGTSEY
jgi:hypothetical protein